jgi:hypothetical protein
MLKEGIDFYKDSNGNFVFTKEYHLRRNVCCGNGCIHCPFNWVNVKDKSKRDKLINESKSKDSSM